MNPLAVYLTMGSAVVALDVTLVRFCQPRKWARVIAVFQNQSDELPEQWRPTFMCLALVVIVALSVITWPALAAVSLYKSIRD